MVEKPITFTWYAGVTHIESATVCDGNTIIFGSRINGVFHENIRLTIEDPKDLALAKRQIQKFEHDSNH